MIDNTKGFPLIFTITKIPNAAWLTTDPITGTISGVPTDEDVDETFTVYIKISNDYKEEYSDSITFTVKGSLSYWFGVITKLIGLFGILPTIWYLRDEIYNLILCRSNYKYPDINVKANENYIKII